VLDAEIKLLNASLSDLNAQIKITEKSIEDLRIEIDKRKGLETSHQLYQHYLEATHRDGIPHEVISVTIPHIEEEVNNILSQLVDFRIVFETDDKNVNAYIAYSEERFWPLELTSGMEKFVSSLAIRTALINISTLPRPNFIAIDEGFGSLDKSNLGSMSLLFDYLKTQFKFIVIISHIDSMRDVVDSYIEIHKVKDKSLVNHE
jgi:DNA repair exonuclease SbcCD ATPase subunit